MRRAAGVAALLLLAACRSPAAVPGAEAKRDAVATTAVTPAPPPPPSSNPMRCTMTDSETRAVLDAHETSSLVSTRSKARAQLDAIPDVDARLLAVATTGDCPAATRFRAFAAYFARGGAEPAPGSAERDALLEVYVAALRSGAEPNLWGLPSGVRSSATSRHLIALGAPAARALAAAFDDDTALAYEGSEEATLASRHRLRVKDLAAGVAAAALGRDFPDEPDPAARDRAIAELRRAAAP